jgi:FkbM family methyltransferase
MAYRPLLARVGHQVKLFAHRRGFDVRRETFKRYFVRALEGRGIDGVLDVGANTGQFARALRQAGFGGRVVSVEPLRDAYRVLSESTALDSRWTAERAAVGARAGVLTINVAGNSLSSSVLPILDRHVHAAPHSRYVATEEVPATTVDYLVARHGLDPARTLLKLDVQGYEVPALTGAAGTLDGLAAVRTEMSLVPLYEGQALMPDLLAHLDAHGFELWLVDPGFVDPATGRPLQVDGVFFCR